MLLERLKWPYLKEKSSDFDAIWYTTSHLELDDIQMTKYEAFKMANSHHFKNRP